jgi:hypothetical protein
MKGVGTYLCAMQYRHDKHNVYKAESTLFNEIEKKNQ